MSEEKCVKCEAPAAYRVVATFRNGPKDGTRTAPLCEPCYQDLERQMRGLGIQPKWETDT